MCAILPRLFKLKTGFWPCSVDYVKTTKRQFCPNIFTLRMRLDVDIGSLGIELSSIQIKLVLALCFNTKVIVWL
jgi:hypothetical protein